MREDLVVVASVLLLLAAGTSAAVAEEMPGQPGDTGGPTLSEHAA